MDSSEEKYTSSPNQHAAGDDTRAPSPSQPLSPSLQRAAQAHYIDPTTAPAPFAPPPPVGAGDDAPTLRGNPVPRWPGQACRYCGWRPVEAGAVCPQCHQPVPVAASWSVPWRPVAIGALSLTMVFMAFLLLHHTSAPTLGEKARGTATTNTTPTVVSVVTTTSVPNTGVPATGATGSSPPAATTGVGGVPSTPVAGVATATSAPGTVAVPTNTPAPGCSWQTSTKSGTYYIFWPGDSTYGTGHYGYEISTTIHYDGCGRAYASADVTSNDVGSPPSFVSAVLYRTADCAGDDKVISQQNTVTLPAGNHSTTTTSPTSPGMQCVFAVAIDKNYAGNSQAATSAIINAG